LDLPIRHTVGDQPFSKEQTTEIQLLRAHFTGAKVVTITEEALEGIEGDTVEHWKALLSDRMVFIYYRYESQSVGRWGEKYIALLGHDATQSLGIAPVEWINSNREEARALLAGRDDDENENPWADFDMDDDDDDDD
jgi:hypothetical protein